MTKTNEFCTWTPAFQNDLSSSGLSRYSPMKKVAKVPAIASHTRTPQQPRRFRVALSIVWSYSRLPPQTFFSLVTVYWATDDTRKHTQVTGPGLLQPLGEAGTGRKSRNIDLRYQNRTRLINHSLKIGKTNSNSWSELDWSIQEICSGLVSYSHHTSLFISYITPITLKYNIHISHTCMKTILYTRFHWIISWLHFSCFGVK